MKAFGRRSSPLLYFIIIACLPAVIWGCATRPGGPPKETFLALASTSRASEGLSSRLLLSASPGQAAGDGYVVGSGDLLQITALKLEEWANLQVRVNRDGQILLPLLGIIQAKGLTERSLEKKLTDLLEERYLHSPRVSVTVQEHRSQRITVLGEVHKPGIYQAGEDRSLIDILSMAGGLTKDADHVVHLVRKNGARTQTAPENRAPTPLMAKDDIVIDLEELLLQGNASLNVTVQSGDVISVPRIGQFFVGGSVKKPGGYPLRGKITADQAVYLAEGFERNANPSEVRIFRDIDGKKEVIEVDLNQLGTEGKSGPVIQKNDVIIVSSSPSKTLGYEALDFLKGIFRVGIDTGVDLRRGF